MTDQQINERIKDLCIARSWTVYRLAKESGITYSTLCTMLNKASAPSMSTLVKICDGFGITLTQFFDTGDESANLSAEQKQHLQLWDRLNSNNQAVAEKFITFLLQEQNK